VGEPKNTWLWVALFEIDGIGAKRPIGYTAEVGKHPDLLVGPPTATVFPTNDRKYKKSQFFKKNFEKI
jgi:hypothetical protein